MSFRLELWVISVAVMLNIKVESHYLPHRSQPERQMWFFIYQIAIRNEGPETVQLVGRHWIITNAEGEVFEVEGDGVIGEQPHLIPGISFQYTSACPLNTPFGTMRGYYKLKNAKDEEFMVPIPEFPLAMPYAIN